MYGNSYWIDKGKSWKSSNKFDDPTCFFFVFFKYFFCFWCFHRIFFFRWPSPARCSPPSPSTSSSCWTARPNSATLRRLQVNRLIFYKKIEKKKRKSLHGCCCCCCCWWWCQIDYRVFVEVYRVSFSIFKSFTGFYLLVFFLNSFNRVILSVSSVYRFLLGFTCFLQVESSFIEY